MNIVPANTWPEEEPEAKAPEYNEFHAVQLFTASVNPILCEGKLWRECDKGTWTETSRHKFRPIAQSVLPPLLRTARREEAILAHVEGARQVSESEFKGFNALEGGTILVNVANGVLRIDESGTSGVIRTGPDPAHRFTLKTAGAYTGELNCPVFLQTLEAAIPDQADRDLFQAMMGTTLLPDSRLEAALVGFGAAGSGKSTLFEGATNTLGGQLVTRLTMGQLCDPKGYHVPKLKRAAVNLGTELDSLEVEDGGVFKALVSGEEIQAREIYGSPFTMRTTAKLFFCSNELPRFRNGTDGELRRMRFIRFDSKPAKPDPTLKARIAAERDGILTWIVQGLCLALHAGIPEGGQTSRDTLARFEVCNDPTGAFVSECCELVHGAREEKAHVQEAYDRFLEHHGLSSKLRDSFLKYLYGRFPSVQPCRVRYDGERKTSISGLKLREGSCIDP